MKNVRHILFLIILVSCLVKASVLLLLSHVNYPLIQPDSPSYLEFTKVILGPHSFWTDQALWMRTPGYPLFLAAIFKCGGGIIAVAVIQLILSNLLVINAYRIGKLLGDSKIGLWAAGLVSLDYVFMSFFPLILTDLLFAIIFSFIFYQLILFMKYPSKRFSAAIIVGLLLALATWIRPISYYLTPLLGVFLLIYGWRIKQIPRAIGCLCFLIVPSLLLIGSWQIRNKAVLGTYQYTGIDAVNFYHYYAAADLAHQKHIQMETAQAQLEAEADAHHLTGLARNDYYRREGLKILFTHPILSARQVMRGFFRMLFGSNYTLLYYNDQQWQQGKQLEFDLKHGHFKVFFHDASWAEYPRLLITGYFHGMNIFLVLGTLYFVIVSLRHSSSNRSAVILCVIVLSYFLLLSSNTCATDRFRVPFQLLLDCFAVLSVFSFLRKH